MGVRNPDFEPAQLHMTEEEAEVLTRVRARLMAWLDEHPEENVECPGCGRSAQLRHDAVRAKLATLAAFWKASGRRVGHPTKWSDAQCVLTCEPGRDKKPDPGYSTLKHWGLLAPVDVDANPAPTGAKTGLWIVTQKGADFLARLITIPAGALIFDNEVWRFTEETPVRWDPDHHARRRRDRRYRGSRA